MPVNSLPIDGLWRCLCPSFDSIVAQNIARAPLSQFASAKAHAGRRKHVEARQFMTTVNRKHSSIANNYLALGDISQLEKTSGDTVRRNKPAQGSHFDPTTLFRTVTAKEWDVAGVKVSKSSHSGHRNPKVQSLGQEAIGSASYGNWGNIPRRRRQKEPASSEALHVSNGLSSWTAQAKDRDSSASHLDQQFVTLGPSKWGAMSFGKQAPLHAQDSQEQLSMRRETDESATNLPPADNTTFTVRSVHGELTDSNSSISSAFNRYKHRESRTSDVGAAFDNRNGIQSSRWDQEELSTLHDRLRAYRMEEGQYERVVALVEYLLIERGDKPALLHYDSLIRANADAEKGSAESVRALLEEMKEEGLKGDSGFYHAVLQALSIHPDYALRAQIMQEMKERWYGLSPEGWHSFVIGLLRDRQLEMAMDRLEEMHNDQIAVQPWLYDIFTYILCENGEHNEAFSIVIYRYDQARLGISLSHWQYLLDTFSAACHYEGTKHVWDARVNAADLVPSDGMCTAVLNVAARNSDPALATSVIKVLSARKTPLNVSHYEALVEAYAGANDPKTALRVLCIMEKAGFHPTSASTRSLYANLSKNSASCIEAWQHLYTLHEESHIIPIAAVDLVLESLSAQNEVDQAFKYYQRLHELCPKGPTTDTINVVLQGLQRSPATSLSLSTDPNPTETTPKSRAMILATELRDLNLAPNALTYDRLIRICVQEEDYEDAFRYLEEMEEVGKKSVERWWMRSGTANEMVLVCARRGDERAKVIVKEMERRGVLVKRGVREMVEGMEKVEGGERNGE